MRRVAVLALVSLAVCATTAVCAVPRCPFPARRGEGGGEDGIVKFCVDDAADDKDDDGKRWRSCARCVGACTIRTYGDAIVGARAVVARTCAMRAIGAIGNLTARARALTRALACADDGLFDVDADANAPTPDVVRRYAEFVTSTSSAARGGVEAYSCGRWRPLDDATWTRIGATYALNIKRCVDACDARDACDGVSFCDDSIGAGCGVDALVAPYEPRTCLLFQRSTPTPTPTPTERENEGGSWCSAEVRTPATARRDRRRGKAFIAYVDSADDDDETK